MTVDMPINCCASIIEVDEPSKMKKYETGKPIDNYVYANGRKYPRQSDGKNTPASDERERADLMHHLQLLTLDGELYKAPLKGDPERVLDCGTGTGFWALDFGYLHPKSQVIGVDWAPVQPTWHWPNVHFENDNLEEDWAFPEESFDFIHSRLLGRSIHDWPSYIEKIFRHCKPGGYIEIAEQNYNDVSCDDDTLPEDTPMLTYWRNVEAGLRKIGSSMDHINEEWFTEILTKVGFVEVQVYTYKIPWSGWPKDEKLKEIGAVTAEIGRLAGEVYGNLMMTKILGKSKAEADEICHRANAANATGKHHAYHYHWQIVARKPERK